MRRKRTSNLLLLLLLTSFFSVLGIHILLEESGARWPKEGERASMEFRAQKMEKKMLPILLEAENQGEKGKVSKLAGVYLLETKFGKQKWNENKKGSLTEKTLEKKLEKWQHPEWKSYLKDMMGIWEDVRYFPIPLSSLHEEYQIFFKDGWMQERTFGGKRGHEGTDLMTAQDVPGRYPVLSMTAGTVMHKGWLPKGGWRIGIWSPHGGYFYYAHLDSYADLEVGDKVRAGTLLGFAGNTGYGPEGTTGKFATHLHIGIYLNPGENEISINPYWILKYLEQSKLTYTYE